MKDFIIENGKLIKYAGEDTSITIPDSVTSIGDEAFRECASLSNITIPNSVTIIGYSAFDGCKLLKSKKANYKAFIITSNNQLKCLKYNFNEKKFSKNIENIEICKQGYHFCTNLFEVFDYYSGEIDKYIAIYECEIGDKVIESATSKCVTNKIKPVKRLFRKDVIRILNGENNV